MEPMQPDYSKVTKDITKRDWEELHRNAQWFTSLKSLEFSKFFGCTMRETRDISKGYSGFYYRNAVCLALTEFLTLKGYTKVNECIIGHDDYYPAKEENIEITPDSFKRVTTEGFLFLEHATHKMVIELEDINSRMEEWGLNVFCDAKHGHLVETLAKDLYDFAMSKDYLKKQKIDPSLKFIKTDKNYTWEDVVIPKVLKNELSLNVSNLLDNVDIYKANNITFKRGVILEGEPGTGKTLIGKILCNSAKSSFIWVTPKFLTSSKAIARICDLSRALSPSILFLEDLDLYASDRDHNVNTSLLGELMNQLDGLVSNNYVIVVATTNKVDFIEEALKSRPGRFDRILTIGKPSQEARKRILQLYTKDMKLEGVDVESLAKLTADFTGAHMKELVNTAVMVAVEKGSLNSDKKVVLKKEFFTDNINKVKNKRFEPTPVGFNEATDDEGIPIGDY